MHTFAVERERWARSGRLCGHDTGGAYRVRAARRGFQADKAKLGPEGKEDLDTPRGRTEENRILDRSRWEKLEARKGTWVIEESERFSEGL